MVGYSGVIFGLIAVENVLLERTTVQPFGLFSMPAAAYPWALLFFIQMLVPQASFLGHLCGLLAVRTDGADEDTIHTFAVGGIQIALLCSNHTVRRPDGELHVGPRSHLPAADRGRISTDSLRVSQPCCRLNLRLLLQGIRCRRWPRDWCLGKYGSGEPGRHRPFLAPTCPLPP